MEEQALEQSFNDRLNLFMKEILTMEEILKDAVRRNAIYQVQFADYDLETWTIPVKLNSDRAGKILTDCSIRKVRIEFEM